MYVFAKRRNNAGSRPTIGREESKRKAKGEYRRRVGGETPPRRLGRETFSDVMERKEKGGRSGGRGGKGRQQVCRRRIADISKE